MTALRFETLDRRRGISRHNAPSHQLINAEGRCCFTCRSRRTASWSRAKDLRSMWRAPGLGRFTRYLTPEADIELDKILIKEAVNWAACYLKRLRKTAASGRVSISCPSLSNELPEKACHNRNSSYACDTVVFGNERLTLLVLTFGGCPDERHFKRFPVLIRTFGGCYEPHFKLFFDRRAGFMSARPQPQIFSK